MNKTKVLALYLPQFHETKHNNEWWGKGYTEWTAVKEATPFFYGHHQPVVPLNKNFYNLLDEETMIWQTNLAKKYGIDGFVLYHYYFGNGRTELERPAENLLNNKKINTSFCFCWANQSWVRSWSKFVGNAWNLFHENKSNESENGVLIEQEYGDENEWKKHFEYLLPFFLDDRYIKHEGKPILMLYRPEEVSCLNSMIAYWRGLAIQSNLPGLYIVSMSKTKHSDCVDTGMSMTTPMDYIRSNYEDVEIRNGVTCIDYPKYCKYIEKMDLLDNEKKILYTLCGYDTTPRMGEKGICIINKTPQLFEEHIKSMLSKSIENNSDYLVINAWNEWGEGMHLEPDEDSKYQYLESLSEAIQSTKNMVNYDNKKCENNNVEKKIKNNNDKYEKFYRVCSKLLDILLVGNPYFAEKFQHLSIDSLAIYGMGNIGIKFLRTLEREGITVKYGIDCTATDKAGLRVFRPHESLPNVDAVIVTAYDEGDIKSYLTKKMSSKVYDIEELL